MFIRYDNDAILVEEAEKRKIIDKCVGCAWTEFDRCMFPFYPKYVWSGRNSICTRFSFSFIKAIKDAINDK